MKKYLLALVLMCCAVLCGCGKNVGVIGGADGPTSILVSSERENTAEPFVRMIKLNGEIYCDTGRESTVTARCGVMDGQITSSVETTEVPTEDNQSNFGKDFGYQIGMTENQIEILYNGRWTVFEKNSKCEGLPLNWGITLAVKDVTQSGLTLVCTQKDGQYDGILQTGSMFRLEKKNGEVWEKLDYCRKDFDFAWTSEAWIINENGKTEWEVEWEWLYGKLPEGDYRIGKEVMDFIKAKEFKTGIYYAYFTIE